MLTQKPRIFHIPPAFSIPVEGYPVGILGQY